jgi:hypothetical protein
MLAPLKHVTEAWTASRSEVEQRIWLPRRIGIELLLSVTGEAEAGPAGEQPAEE